MGNEHGLAIGQAQDESLMPTAVRVIRQNFRDDAVACYLSAALLRAEYTPGCLSSRAGETSEWEVTIGLV